MIEMQKNSSWVNESVKNMHLPPDNTSNFQLRISHFRRKNAFLGVQRSHHIKKMITNDIVSHSAPLTENKNVGSKSISEILKQFFCQ